MRNLQIVRSLRKQFNKPVFALLIFYVIMNAAVMISVLVQVVVTVLNALLSGQGAFDEALLEQMIVPIFTNGWGYILTYAIGFVVLLLWKKPQFCFREIWQKKSGMRLGTILTLLCMMTAMQALFELGAELMQWFFGLFGMEFDNSVVTDSVDLNSFSMVFYMGILAPVGEEVLFRGLLLRWFRPYGKKFSVLATALLFGLFHGNLLQSGFAFCVGLILGYVTVEYSMGWAIVLHMFNNLILCYLLPMGLGAISPVVMDLVMTLLIWGCAIGTLLILVIKRLQVREYICNKRIHPLCMKGFFGAPATIIFMCMMGFSILSTLYLQIG